MALIEFAAVNLRGGEGLTGWRAEAACIGIDPALFFPERGDAGQPATEAKATCASCPVQAECLDYAVRSHQLFGIWGGMNEVQRRPARSRAFRERRAAAMAAPVIRATDDAAEVRQVAVELVNEMREAGNGRNAVAEVAEALEVSETDLRAWVKAEELGRGYGRPTLADLLAPELDPSWFREKPTPIGLVS